MTTTRPMSWRRFAGPLAIAIGAFAAASLLRFGWLENGRLAALCDAQAGCLLKSTVDASLADRRLGWAALLIALIALATRWRAAALLALVLACAGLLLYGASPAAPAFWLAVLLLAGAWPEPTR